MHDQEKVYQQQVVKLENEVLQLTEAVKEEIGKAERA